MSETKTQIEQIRDVLEVLRLRDILLDRSELTKNQSEKIVHTGKVTLDAILGL